VLTKDLVQLEERVRLRARQLCDAHPDQKKVVEVEVEQEYTEPYTEKVPYEEQYVEQTKKMVPKRVPKEVKENVEVNEKVEQEAGGEGAAKGVAAGGTLSAVAGAGAVAAGVATGGAALVAGAVATGVFALIGACQKKEVLKPTTKEISKVVWELEDVEETVCETKTRTSYHDVEKHDVKKRMEKQSKTVTYRLDIADFMAQARQSVLDEIRMSLAKR
jgi:hypothetical protein